MLADLYAFDRAVFLFFFGGKTPSSATLGVMLALTIVGRGYVLWAVAMLAFLPKQATRYLPHRVFSRERQKLARELLVTLVAIALTVYAIKAVVQRPRPYLALDLVPLGKAPTDYSFPSGHAAGAFSFVWFFIARLRPSYRATALLLLFAVGIGISRIYLGAHYPSDVLAGTILGSLGGGFAGHLYRKHALAKAALGPQLANSPTHEA